MDNLIKEVIKYLKETYNCHSIILYGSFADNTYTSESDIDIICFTEDATGKTDNKIFSERQLDAFIYHSDMMKNYSELSHISGGLILLDEKNLCTSLLNNIDNFSNKAVTLTKEESDFQKSWLKKMLNRCKRNDVEGNFRYHWLLVDSLEIYFSLNSLRYLGPKKSLIYLKNNNKKAYTLFENALSKNSSMESLEALIEFIINT